MSYIKIEKPWKLENEGLTDLKFQRWKNKLESFLETDANYRKFLPGGRYDTWISEEKNPQRIVAAVAPDEATVLEEFRCQLRRVLIAVTDYVHEDQYIPIMRHSTSFTWIYNKLRKDNSIQHKGIHFMAIHKLKWDQESQSPVGFYNSYRSIIMSNLVSSGTKVDWAEETPDTDEKMTYTFEDLILSNVLSLLHPKLPAYIEKEFADKIKDNKRLMDYKDEILAQAKTFIDDIESKDDTLQLSAAHYVPQTEPQCNFVQQNNAYRQNRPYRQKFQPNRSFTQAPLP